jgi:hypothetical protein
MTDNFTRLSVSGAKSGMMKDISMILLVAWIACLVRMPATARAQSNASTTWAVSIVLPPKLVAGKTATLAVLGVDGRLAEGITVTVGETLRLKTDHTGRATFAAPSGVPTIIANGSGNSAAALVDAEEPSAERKTLIVSRVVSLLDQFAICGGHFLEQVDANRVELSGERAFVLAASPECLVVLANPRALPGPAKITVENSSGKWETDTTLVSLHFDPPIPTLVPEEKSKLALHVQGSDQALHVLVENRTPGVLRFLRGETQSLLTSGGEENSGNVSVIAVSAGDFSFRARILAAPDPVTALRYLLSAEPLAPKNWRSRIKAFARDLDRHPGDAAKISRELQIMEAGTIAGDFKTLLEAARTALR